MDVLEERANKLMVPLKVVAPLDWKKYGIKLSLSGDHQLINAGLAVSLCKSWLESTRNWESVLHKGNQQGDLPGTFLRGLSTAHLSGRAQVLHDSYLRCFTSPKLDGRTSGDLIFYLDGAHSPESMEACARWFSVSVKENEDKSFSRSSLKVVGTMKESRGNGYIRPGKSEFNKLSKKILLFNCMDVRDPKVLFSQLVNTCASSGTYFSKAIFVPSISTYSKITSGASDIPLVLPSTDLTWQLNLQRIWEATIHGKGDASPKTDTPVNSPPKSLNEDLSRCNPANGHFSGSAVFGSLPLAINWLRVCQRRPFFKASGSGHGFTASGRRRVKATKPVMENLSLRTFSTSRVYHAVFISLVYLNPPCYFDAVTLHVNTSKVELPVLNDES